MIIWGWTTREKRLGDGDFFCPQCGKEREYDHKALKRYFTLYFIPLIPLETVLEYVQCDRCGGQFEPEVLDLDPEELREAAKPWKCPSCDNRNPGEYDRCLSCETPKPRKKAARLTEFVDDE